MANEIISSKEMARLMFKDVCDQVADMPLETVRKLADESSNELSPGFNSVILVAMIVAAKRRLVELNGK